MHHPPYTALEPVDCDAARRTSRCHLRFAWRSAELRAGVAWRGEHAGMTEDSPRAGASGNRPRIVSLAEQHELFQQILRRNAVSRRSILRGGVSATGAAFLL